MSLMDQIGQTKTVIRTTAGLIALLPPVAILTGLVDIPPSLIDLIKMLSFFVSVGILLAIFLLGKHISRVRSGWMAAATIAAILLGGIFATSYMLFANRHIAVVARGDDTERYVVPLHPSPAIQRIMAGFGGDYVEALQTSSQSARLEQLMQEEDGSSTMVMIALLVAAQTLLVAGVVAAAWRLALDDKAAPPAGP